MYRQSASCPIVSERDQRAVGQFAYDLVQHYRRDRCRAGAFDLRRCPVDHLDIQICCAEMHRVALGLDQYVGKDRNGVAPLDHRLRL